ncbi:Regulator of nucleoside diphosphate kinase [Serratia odorifera]|nr:Regulator of nucleoside diphosphate kinase [Serratia odorifera]
MMNGCLGGVHADEKFVIGISFFSCANPLLSEEQTDISNTPAPHGAGVLLCVVYLRLLESGMTKPIITINELDAERLDALLEKPAYANTDVAAALNAELDRAEILPPAQIPAHVVTMNSRVRFRDLHTNEEHVRTLVYPAELQNSSEQLSVMAPLGAALLGMHVGKQIDWALPNGEQAQIEVLELLYQPEAAGVYHR